MIVRRRVNGKDVGCRDGVMIVPGFVVCVRRIVAVLWEKVRVNLM